MGEKYDVYVAPPTLEEFMFPENRNIVTETDIEILKKKELDDSVKLKPGDNGIGLRNVKTEKKVETLTKKTENEPKPDINRVIQLVGQVLEYEKKTNRERFEETERRVNIIKLKYDIDQIKNVYY